MLSAQAAIRLILDAATNDNFEAAVEALNDYADHRNNYQTSIINIGEHNTGDMVHNIEEIRNNFPDPVPSPLMHQRV